MFFAQASNFRLKIIALTLVLGIVGIGYLAITSTPAPTWQAPTPAKTTPSPTVSPINCRIVNFEITKHAPDYIIIRLEISNSGAEGYVTVEFRSNIGIDTREYYVKANTITSTIDILPGGLRLQWIKATIISQRPA